MAKNAAVRRSLVPLKRPGAPVLSQREIIDRSLTIEIVRVTERAAVAAARLRGRGDEMAADKAAVEAMRRELNQLPIHGVVHIVVIPVAAALVLSILRLEHAFLYRWALFGMLSVYMMGISSVLLAVFGLGNQTLMSLWDASVYDRILLPLLLGLLSLPVCFQSRSHARGSAGAEGE